MDYTLSLILKLLSIIFIAIIGYFIGKKNILPDSGIDVVSIILNKIALPSMVLASYLTIKLTKETLINSAYLIIAAIIIYFINLTYVTIITKKSNLTNKQESVYINGALHTNSAFLAFPLLIAVFGNIGLFYGTIYFMIDNILLFTRGIKRFQKDNENSKKIATVTWAIIIAIPLMIISNIFNISFTNNFIFDAVNEISHITIPLAFLFIGMIISQQKIKDLVFNKLALLLVSIKYIVVPFIAIAFFYFVPLNLDKMLIIIIMVELLMPVFASLIPIAHEYKKDTALAASLVVISHLMAIITIPIIFSIVIILFS